MNYISFYVSGEEYKLRLTTRNVIALEDRLGRSPIHIILDLEQGIVPMMKDVSIILHEAMQKFQHEIKLEDCYDILDEYVSDGHTLYEFVTDKVIELFKDCGLISKDTEDEVKETEETKN